MSSNPDAQAGKRGTRVLDEFALHPDPRKLYAIAYPGITWGGSMQIISTHRGSQNLFNDLVQEIIHKGNPKGFSLHTVTLQDALDQGFLEKLKTKLPPDDERQGMDAGEYFDFIRAGCPDEETFQQEYMCQPSDDASAFLTYDLIRGCEYPAAETWEKTIRELAECKNPLYLGVDVGRDHDLTVMWLLEKFGGVFFTRKKIELRGETFDSQEQKHDELLSLPMLRRDCIDATGIGRQFAERAQQRFGTYKVEQVQFTGPVKEELAYPLRAAFEDKSVRIPNDELVRADLRAVKKETTASGNIRFTADRGKNGHADRFWALALALHAGKDMGGGGMPHRIDAPPVRSAFNRKDRSVLA
jgi:phage FluMu gp28-like protein